MKKSLDGTSPDAIGHRLALTRTNPEAAARYRSRRIPLAILKGEGKQQAIITALGQAKTLCPCPDDRVFQQFINDALPFKATTQLVTALRSAFGETNVSGKVQLKPLEPDFDQATAEADPGKWYQTDSGLRDEEHPTQNGY